MSPAYQKCNNNWALLPHLLPSISQLFPRTMIVVTYIESSRRYYECGDASLLDIVESKSTSNLSCEPVKENRLLSQDMTASGILSWRLSADIECNLR